MVRPVRLTRSVAMQSSHSSPLASVSESCCDVSVEMVYVAVWLWVFILLTAEVLRPV